MFDPAGPLREGMVTVARPGEYSKVHGASYAAIQKVLKGSPLEVKGGSKAVNTDAAQMSVTVIPPDGGDGDGDQWGARREHQPHRRGRVHLLPGLQHALRLRAGQAPEPRAQGELQLGPGGAVGEAESKLYYSTSFFLNCVGTMLFGGAVKSRCRLVDPSKVEAAKAAAKADGDSAFVSTNDLLVAAWAKLTRAQLLEMPINLRNRLPGIGDADAGNYEYVVFYQEEDCLRPGQIRKSISATPGRYMRCGQDPPRPLRSGWGLARARYALITNWATFARGLDLPGCEQRLHLPFFNSTEAPCEMAFVFRATATETGVLMLSRHLRDKDLMGGGSVFGATVDPVIFPDR